MKTLTKPCLQCGKIIKKHWKYSRLQWESQKTCSYACLGKYLAKLPERLKKLSKQKKGKKNPNWKGGKPKCLICKKVLSNYGLKHCKPHQPPNNWKGENAS